MKPIYKKILIAFLPPFFLYLFQYLAQALWGIYFRYPNFDITMHFLGGVTMAMTGVSLLHISEEKSWLLIKKKSITLLLVVSFVGLTAVLWEFHEFLFDHYLGTHMQPSVFDTMKDLFLGLLGAFFTGVFFVFKKA